MKALKRTVTLAMIVLVVLLPVAFAEIQSGTLVAYGEDNLPGFAKQTDTVSVNATVKLDGDATITPDQVLINTVLFTACAPKVPNGTVFNCIYQPGGPSFLPAGNRAYNVILKDDAGTNQDVSTVSFTVDAGVPQITSVSASSKTIAAGNASVSVSVTDPGACVGIQKIQLFKGTSTPISTFTESKLKECTKTQTLSFNGKSVFPSDGDQQICARATDHLGQESALSCITVTVDTTAPTLGKDSFSIKSSSGDAITYIKGQVFAKVSAEFSDSGSGLNTGLVYADLSALNGNTAYEKRLGTCSSAGSSTHKCEWNGIPIILKDSTKGIVTFSVKDMADNIASHAVAFSIDFDDTAPKALSLTSEHTVDGTSYLGAKKNNLTLTVEETGSGLDNENVYLNLQPIGGSAQQSPDHCYKAGSNWKCEYSNIDIPSLAFNKRKIKLSTTPGSTDDVGNTVTVDAPFEFVVDNKKPKLVWANVTTEDPYGTFKSGDAIQVEVHLEDDTPVTGMGNFSALIEGMDDEKAVCAKKEQDGNKLIQECAWSEGLTPLREGKIRKEMVLSFTDGAGNVHVEKKAVTVYGIDDESVPNYLRSTVGEPSPFAVDRQLMQLSNAFITFPVKLDGRDVATPISVELNDCTGNGLEYLNNAEPYANKPQLITSDNLEELYLDFSFDQQSYPEDIMNLTCSLNVVSLVNNQKLSKKEVENLTIDIPFYNAPYGELTQNVKDEIKDTMDGFLVESTKWVNTLDDMVSWMEKICGVYNTIQNIMLIISKVVSLWGTCCGAIYSSAVCCPKQQVSVTQLEGTKERLIGTYNVFKKWCSLVGCTAYSGQWSFNKDAVVDKYFKWAQKNRLPVAQYRTNKGWLGNVEPKNSLLLSAAFFCLPGVIHNFQKMRSIECQYADCLMNTQNGLPIEVCSSQRGYMTCKYVLGEVFNLIPFAAALSTIAQNVDRALKNPLNTIAAGLSAGCWKTCRGAGTGALCSACSWIEFAGITKDVFCDLGLGWEDRCQRGIFNSEYWDTGSVCSRVQERYEKEKDTIEKSSGGSDDEDPF